MKRGLFEVGVLLVVAIVLAQLLATLWTWAAGGSFLQHLGVSLAVIGILTGLIGGDLVFSRIQSSDERAFLGFGPERFESKEGEGLTSVGRFLFVGLPLFVLGLALLAL